MGVIIKGQNTPIRVRLGGEIEFENIETLSVLLCTNKKEVKRWGREDVAFEENLLSLPLTEKETMFFPNGTALLLIKALDPNNYTLFWKKKEIEILDWEDRKYIVNSDTANEPEDEPEIEVDEENKNSEEIESELIDTNE